MTDEATPAKVRLTDGLGPVALEPHRKPYAREAFEAWASDSYKWPNAIERSGDGYRLMQTQASWDSWVKAWAEAEASSAERLRKAEERCSAWADIAGAHGAQADRLRALLREVSANRWESATEDGACPDCGAEDSEPHDAGCLLGQIDAEAFNGPNVNSATPPVR